MSEASTAASAHFVEKWLQREPGMRFASIFCAPSMRPRFNAWGALLNELRESMFDLSDAGVTQVKLSWWAEELTGVSQGRHQHPLSVSLLETTAPWLSLSRALLDFDTDPPRAANTLQAIAAIEVVAASAAAVEARLFAAPRPAPPSHMAVHWLAQRLPQGLVGADQGRVPMHLFARHGLTAEQVAAGDGHALLRDWAGELLQAIEPLPSGTALISSCRSRFSQQRLQRLADGHGFGAPSPLAMLWQAWRAARQS